MNRRKLLQSLASLTAIRFMFKGSEIKAFPLQKGKDYLFVINMHEIDAEQLVEGLSNRGFTGSVHPVTDVDAAMKIYDVG